MKKTFVLLFIFLLCWGVAISQVDPFYLQAFAVGKKLVQQKSFEEAIERFKVAEFGLMEDLDVLNELYLYVALAYYHLEQFDDVRKTMKKLKASVGDIDLSAFPLEPGIKRDLTVMLVELNYIEAKKIPKAETPKIVINPESRSNSKALIGFGEVRDLIKNKKLKEGARQLKKLKRKNRQDPRVSLLEGLLSFYKDEYLDSIEKILDIYDVLKGEDRDEASYYLVLSYYFKKNYGQALAFFQKITNSQTRNQLQYIYNRIVTGRQSDIDRVAKNFSLGDLEKLVDRYAGDQFLCESIFRTILELKKGENSSLEPVVYGCLRFPQAINGDFIVLAAKYLEKINKSRNAIKVIKKYLNNRPLDESDTEVYYTLGKLYLGISSPNRALKEFSIADKLKPGYKNSKKYIKEINRNYKNRKK